jgi:hypothetical protein
LTRNRNFVDTGGAMPTDETRRVLKVFGVAVTAFEDAINNRAPAHEVSQAEIEVRARLEEVTALIERLHAAKK